MQDHVPGRPRTEGILQQEPSSFWRVQLEEFTFKPPQHVHGVLQAGVHTTF